MRQIKETFKYIRGLIKETFKYVGSVRVFGKYPRVFLISTYNIKCHIA